MQRRKTTKELIADSFIELSEKKSIDKIKIKDITDNCELTPTTFYNHFNDKYDLIVWIYSVQLEKIMNKIGQNGYNLQNALVDCIKYYAENKKFLINAITHTSGQNSFINNMSKINFNALSNYLKRINNLDELPQDLSIIAKMYVYGTICVSCEWLIDKNPIEIDKFIKLLGDGVPESIKKYLYKNSEI